MAARAAPVLAALGLLVPATAAAQTCCSPATTPSAAIERPALPRGALALALHAERFALAGGRRGRETFDYPGDRETAADVVSLSAHYGLTHRVSLGAVVPVNRRERSDVDLSTGARFTRRHAGVGDVAALAYLSVLPRPSPREWTVGAGVKFATGDARAEDETGELPEELQPGSGANDVLLTSTYAQALGPLTASASATWRVTGTLVKVDTVPDGTEVRRSYRFGDEWWVGVAAGWSPSPAWGIELGLRGRHAAPDRASGLNPDGSTTSAVARVPSTGSERVFLAPVVRRLFAVPRASVAVGLLLPIHQNVRGSQLSAEPGVRLSVESQL